MQINKNLTFTITHGRTGTTFVTNLFELFDDTLSVHEPDPNYAHAFPKVKLDPRFAVQFLKTKMESVLSISESNYVETSNVFCKGYFLPFIRHFDHYPNLLLLNRDFRRVATSLYKRGSIPERSQNGKLFSCETAQPGTLPIYGAADLSDYQICYWAVLDAFKRQLDAVKIYEDKGLDNFVWCTPETFHDFDFFKQAGEKLGLKFADEDAAKAKHEELVGTKFNLNPDRKVEEISDEAKNIEEAKVIDRIAYFDLSFVNHILEHEFLDDGVKKLFQE